MENNHNHEGEDMSKTRVFEHDQNSENSDMTTEEVAQYADDKVDALIQLLIKKKVITEQELETEYNSLFEEWFFCLIILAVYILSVADLDDENNKPIIIHVANDAIIAYSETITLNWNKSFKIGVGANSNSIKCICDAKLEIRWKFAQLTFRTVR